MPTITETPVTLYAFCVDATCPGYEQTPVDGLAREVSRSAFEEAGPGTVNGNSVSTSFFQYLVPSGEQDEYGHAYCKELECEHCGRSMSVSPEQRPEYANISGQDPMTLLMRRKDAEAARDRDTTIAGLQAQVETLMAMRAPDASAELEQLRAKVAELEAKPKKGGA
jgi:hypothetical protein